MKELKSHLGADQYQFQEFAAVEGSMEMAAVAMQYLESSVTINSGDRISPKKIDCG